MDTLNTQPDLRIDGDVPPGAGPLCAAGLIVGGVIRAGAIIRASGNIRVEGAVEAATIDCGGHLDCDGGCVGGATGGGLIRVAGNASFRFINRAQLEVGADLTVHEEIIGSNIRCRGNIDIERGTVLASTVCVAGSLRCRTLGSPGAARANVTVGVDQGLRDETLVAAKKIDEFRARVMKLRNGVAPLLRYAGSATSPQQSQITAMLAEVEQCERGAAELIQSLKQRWEAAEQAGKPEIMVRQLLHAGVQIRFADSEAYVAQAVRGPVRIICRSLPGERTIVLVDPGSRSWQALETRRYSDPAVEVYNRIVCGQLDGMRESIAA